MQNSNSIRKLSFVDDKTREILNRIINCPEKNVQTSIEVINKAIDRFG